MAQTDWMNELLGETPSEVTEPTTADELEVAALENDVASLIETDERIEASAAVVAEATEADLSPEAMALIGKALSAGLTITVEADKSFLDKVKASVKTFIANLVALSRKLWTKIITVFMPDAKGVAKLLSDVKAKDGAQEVENTLTATAKKMGFSLRAGEQTVGKMKYVAILTSNKVKTADLKKMFMSKEIKDSDSVYPMGGNKFTVIDETGDKLIHKSGKYETGKVEITGDDVAKVLSAALGKDELNKIADAFYKEASNQVKELDGVDDDDTLKVMKETAVIRQIIVSNNIGLSKSAVSDAKSFLKNAKKADEKEEEKTEEDK